LRSLRLSPATAPWAELSRAGWLRTVPSSGQAVTVQLLDVLTQHPARPDRLQAADWALRTASRVRAGATSLQQLAALSLTTRTTRGGDHGFAEAELLVREFGSSVATLPLLFGELAARGVLATWAIVRETGEVRWTLGVNGRST
jgi:hypothetical protein